jgi:hypothetical protein
MSIGDPLRLRYQTKRNTWIVCRGRETFYDDDRYLIEHETPEAAIAWSEAELGETPLMPDEVFQLALMSTKLRPLPPGRRSPEELPLWNRRSRYGG